jgi:glycosyl-4,4'-diaponeurosporenoate acyltransferase
MLLVLPEIWIIIIDIVLWFIIHMSVAYIATILPLDNLNTESWLLKERNWEKSGNFYDRFFKIKKWKGLLPDGSALFKKGFRKKRMTSSNPEYLSKFIIETGRAEIVHWIVILFSPVFFIWNYPWAGWVMIIYAIIANLPCILAQRYNRIRFKRMISKNSGKI